MTLGGIKIGAPGVGDPSINWSSDWAARQPPGLLPALARAGFHQGAAPAEINFRRISSVAPRHAREIKSSNRSIGAEVMDRDYTVYKNWREYLGPLGFKRTPTARKGAAQDAARPVPEKETSYPNGSMFSSLPAYGFYCRHARGLRLHNLDLTLSSEDARPAIIAEDVEDLDLFGLRARQTPAAMALVRLQDVRGALIHGCRPLDPNGTFLNSGAASAGISLTGNDLRGVRNGFLKDAGFPAGALASQESAGSRERP